MRVVVTALMVAAWLAQSSSPARSTAPPGLPPPTGQHGVGRTTVHLLDASRKDPDGRARRISVDVWYPAETGAGGAVYLSPVLFQNSESVRRLRGYLRGAYDAVASGAVTTSATANAQFARAVSSSPFLVFSHGGGEMKETYAAQLSDLASHGYTVASIAHTYDALVSAGPADELAFFETGRWPAPATSAIEGLPANQQVSADQLRWWADDIRHVIDGLSGDKASPGWPFNGRLDAQAIGAFGHSFGGEAAATACQRDSRIRACLDQDGLSGRAPYYLQTDGWGMDQPFMLVFRLGPREPPPDDELARMGLTRSQAIELAARMDARQLETLRQTGGGIRVAISPANTSHSDFGDLPLLQATDALERTRRQMTMDVVRRYTRAFFDRTLRRMPSTVLDGPPDSPLVISIERFPPAQRRP